MTRRTVKKMTHKERLKLLWELSPSALTREVKCRLEGETEPLGEPDRQSREAYIDILLEAYNGSPDLNFKNRFRQTVRGLLEQTYLSHAAVKDSWYIWRLAKLSACLLRETMVAP